MLQDTPYPGGTGPGARRDGQARGRTRGTAGSAAQFASVGRANGGGALLPHYQRPRAPLRLRTRSGGSSRQPVTGVQGYFRTGVTRHLRGAVRVGDGFVRDDPFDKEFGQRLIGLQRFTNFTANNRRRYRSVIPSIFVSPEDVVWQEADNQAVLDCREQRQRCLYTRRSHASHACDRINGPSPVIPDLSITTTATATRTQSNDFHYSWMFTGLLVNSSNQACFDGNIVIFENRPFGICAAVDRPFGATSQLRSTRSMARRSSRRSLATAATSTAPASGTPPGPHVRSCCAGRLRARSRGQGPATGSRT